MKSNQLLSDSTYHINDIIAALQQKDVYLQKAETGEMQFVDLVIDAERCKELAGLTEHQQLVCNLRWGMGFTLEQCSRLLGNSKEAVREAEEAMKKKLMKVLAEWGKQT